MSRFAEFYNRLSFRNTVEVATPPASAPSVTTATTAGTAGTAVTAAAPAAPAAATTGVGTMGESSTSTVLRNDILL